MSTSERRLYAKEISISTEEIGLFAKDPDNSEGLSRDVFQTVPGTCLCMYYLLAIKYSILFLVAKRLKYTKIRFLPTFPFTILPSNPIGNCPEIKRRLFIFLNATYAPTG